MSTILKRTLGRAATIVAIAGLAVTALATSASAWDGHEWNRGNGNHGYHRNWDRHWDHARRYGGGYYGPRYYAAAPVVAYPTAYYGPPSLNFNIPLG
ncbi:MAG: hypothetical protein WCP68_00365 [Enhydrobacter sp.]